TKRRLLRIPISCRLRASGLACVIASFACDRRSAARRSLALLLVELLFPRDRRLSSSGGTSVALASSVSSSVPLPRGPAIERPSRVLAQADEACYVRGERHVNVSHERRARGESAERYPHFPTSVPFPPHMVPLLAYNGPLYSSV